LVETTGIYEMTPKKHDIFIYKHSIEVGEVESDKQIWAALSKLLKKYRANQYDMLMFNCNHFTNEFLILLTGKQMPRHLNRIAYTGSFLHCIIPKRFLTVTPDMTDVDCVECGIDQDEKNYNKIKTNEDSQEDDEFSSDDDDIMTESSSNKKPKNHKVK
jgi:ADP-heptose:LPS heptosyltransferase